MKVWEIIRVIEESPVRATLKSGSDIEFTTPDGHRFEVFMDNDEPDYLNWFYAADGERIDFWPDAELSRALTGLNFLASNLLAMPHVAERLKTAARFQGFM